MAKSRATLVAAAKDIDRLFRCEGAIACSATFLHQGSDDEFYAAKLSQNLLYQWQSSPLFE